MHDADELICNIFFHAVLNNFPVIEFVHLLIKSQLRKKSKMSVLFRARLSSFLAGLGVATGACMYQLKHDIDQSYSIVLDAVRFLLNQ